jgi:hypothetical protein
MKKYQLTSGEEMSVDIRNISIFLFGGEKNIIRKKTKIFKNVETSKDMKLIEIKIHLR